MTVLVGACPSQAHRGSDHLNSLCHCESSYMVSGFPFYVEEAYPNQDH